MNEERNRRLLIDALMGIGLPSIEYAERMRKIGLAKFTGNQWNEDWQWKKDKLESLDTKELEILYDECSLTDG